MAAKKKTEQKVVVKKSQSQKIREMDAPTIEKTIEELKQELFNLRLQAAVGKLENTAQIRKDRKQIARMKTILTERANALKN
ncbi:MAG: 50S ribosomal protein L29 [Bacilli bacterium]